MSYTYRLTRIIPASPLDVYEAWLDSEAHSQMTGAEARMSDKVGADFSAWDDYIRGRNLELVPGERIVQAWRTSKFTGENEDSIVTITLEEADDGTLLTLVHSNVPDEQKNYEEGGWESNYFTPMRAYFAGLAEEGEAEEDADELEEEEKESAEEDNGDEDDEDEDEDEEEDEEGDEDDDEDDEDEDEEEDEDEDEEDEDEEDEDEEDELKEALEERVAKGPKDPEHAPPKPPAVKRTAGRPAKKAAPRAKALPGKKTKRAAAAPRKGKLKPKPKSKLMGKAKKKTAAKRARPAAKKAKRAASKKKSAGRKRARR